MLEVSCLKQEPSVRSKSKMFPFITCTWNPITGCFHDCIYCWARKLAESKLKETPRYREGFRHCSYHLATIHPKFKPDDFVFVSDMGDMFGEWVKMRWIQEVIEEVRKCEPTHFLFLTKNPRRYHFFSFPESIVVRGATIETNREIASELSKAPTPIQRLLDMNLDQWENPSFISIEPIMDFDLEEFSQLLLEIHPRFGIAIGYDNYKNNLPEPSLEKTMELIHLLEYNGIKVFRKTLREVSV